MEQANRKINVGVVGKLGRIDNVVDLLRVTCFYCCARSQLRFAERDRLESTKATIYGHSMIELEAGLI